MIDGDEADDKIIAVLENDAMWGKARKLSDLPQALIERLRHYFSTYKILPGEKNQVIIEQVYEVAHAHKVITASLLDYAEEFEQ